ncbi:MAG: hypothetical protein AB7I48_09835 [Planctomycetaceae bacterium]
MHRIRCLVLIVSALPCLALPASAEHAGQSYPRVRTFSGGFYGPTQAHYQYQRQYGRPWHGQNGLYGGVGAGYVNGYPAYLSGYGAVYGGWAFPPIGYGIYVSPFGSSAYYNGSGTYAPLWGGGGYGLPSPWSGFTSPVFGGYGVSTSPTLPGWTIPPAAMNPVLSDAWDENIQQWEQPLELQPVIPSGKPALPASTPAARIRSIQLQDQADRRLRDIDYFRASTRYRDAISAAADRAEPHLHLAIALAGMKQFDDAVHEVKVGLALDPSWPTSGVSLDTLLGVDNAISKMQLKQRTAEWTLHDVRDPDRLFLLGVLLYLDHDAERGRMILETAARLGGLRDYLAVFLRAGDAGGVAGEVQVPSGADVSQQADDQAATVLPELPPLPPATGAGPSEFVSPAPQISGPAFPQ